MSLSRPRVVIIGGSFAGLSAAARLSRAHDVTVIDGRKYFEWTPNIHEVLSGVKGRDGLVLPRKKCVERYGHAFLQDVVTSVDPNSSVVCTEGGLTLPYDVCLVAAGTERTTYGIDGADKHALGLRLVDDAVRISSRLDKLAKRSRRASVVIVGGGVSGIEALGEILRRRGRGDEFNIHVVDAASSILNQQPGGMVEDAESRFFPYRIQLHTSAAVAQVGARSVTLDDGRKLTSDLCIWSAGIRLPEFLGESGLKDPGDQWLPVDPSLKSRHADNIFVAGDCADLPVPARKQAYHAMGMGEVAGENMARLLRGRRLKRFRPASTPMLISLGDITTWMVSGETVIASPLLAAAKEGVYQATMARLQSPKEGARYAQDVVSRGAMATRKLLLPQLTTSKLCLGLTGSRIVAVQG